MKERAKNNQHDQGARREGPIFEGSWGHGSLMQRLTSSHHHIQYPCTVSTYEMSLFNFEIRSGVKVKFRMNVKPKGNIVVITEITSEIDTAITTKVTVSQSVLRKS